VKKTRVLIVEDSATMRLLLEEIVRQDQRLQLFGSCDSAEKAIELLGHSQPDVISMDILLPGMDGLQAIQQILQETPIPIVVISSTTSSAESRHAMEALHAGALAVLPKPEGPDAPGFPRQTKRIADNLFSMSQVRVMRRMKTPKRQILPGSSNQQGRPPIANPQHPDRVRAIGIAASTGGPPALVDLLAPLPPSFPIPILLVQHIAPGFAESFASWLESCISLRVHCAKDHEQLLPGHVHLAPDALHLAVHGDRVRLLDLPPVGVHKPSADVLFDSMAGQFGCAAAGIILTGMGRDGARGLLALKNTGAWTAGQEEVSCAVFGMPMAAQELGALRGLYSLPHLTQHLLTLKPCPKPAR
jgi:two-component system chemotaxis response regulator CheB